MTNKSKLHLKSDCMFFFLHRKIIPFWQKHSWKSCFLTSVIGTNKCQKRCLSKHEGGEIQWGIPARGACRPYRPRHNSQEVFEFKGVCHECSSGGSRYLAKGVSNPGVHSLKIKEEYRGRGNLTYGGRVTKWAERHR